jgi:hypothetical protein
MASVFAVFSDYDKTFSRANKSTSAMFSKLPDSERPEGKVGVDILMGFI